METYQSTYLTAVNIKTTKPSNQITEISTQNPSHIVNTIDIIPENDNKSLFTQKMDMTLELLEI